MRYPSQLFPDSVAPICAPFMSTTRCTGVSEESVSMTSRRYGVRLVRHRPGSADPLPLNIRCWSAHSLTVREGSGFHPLHAGRTQASREVGFISPPKRDRLRKLLADPPELLGQHFVNFREVSEASDDGGDTVRDGKEEVASTAIGIESCDSDLVDWDELAGLDLEVEFLEPRLEGLPSRSGLRKRKGLRRPL